MGHHTWGDVWWPLWGPCEIWVRTTDFFDKLQKVGTLWEHHRRSAQWSMPPKSWRLTVKWSAQLFIGISFHANKDLIGNWPNWDQLVIAVPQCRGTSSLSHFSSTTIIIIHTVSVNKLKIIWKACGCALGRSVGTGFNHLCMRWLVWWLQGLGFEWRRLLLSNWYHWHQVAALARLWYFNNIFSFNILIKVLNKNDTLKLIHNVKFNNLCTRGLGKGCPCRFSQSLRKPCRWPFCIAEQFCGQEVCTLRFPLWRPSSLLLCRLHGPRRS